MDHLLLDKLQSFVSHIWMGNTYGRYLIAVLLIFIGIVFRGRISKLLGKLIFRVFQNNTSGVNVNEFLLLIRKPAGVTIMLLFIYAAFSRLTPPEFLNSIIIGKLTAIAILKHLFFIILYSSVIWIFIRLADFFSLVLSSRPALQENKYSGQLIPFVTDFIKILIFIVGVLTILAIVFGVNVGTMVAGLGIGGLAIALAAKETLENLLGSFTIFLDKPFTTGDLVKVGNVTGTVERVGFRSTRLRTLEKSFVTLPNKRMIDSELDNLTQRTLRRCELSLGLTYSTTTDQLKAIMTDLHKWIESEPLAAEDVRVRLHNFGPSSIDIMILFFVDSPDWDTYLEVKERLLFAIIDIVKNNQAEFAFPSTSVYIEKEPEKQV